MRAILFLAGLLLALLRPALAEDIKVAIGFPPSDDFVPAMIAKDKGMFAAHGIDATLTVVPLIGNVPPALVAGSLQIGATTGPTIVQAQENGLDLVVVSGMSRLDATHQLVSVMVGEKSGIEKPQDLKGKRVGVPGLNSFLDLTFRRWLINNGVPADSVTYIETSFPQMGDLLRSGQLDAVIIKEPARANALAKNAGRILADYPKEVAPDLLNTLWIAERGWAEKNRAAIQGFRAALDEAIAFYEQNPAEGRAIQNKYMKGAPGPLPKFSTGVSIADLVYMQGLARQFGQIQGKQDPAKLILQ